MCSRRWRPQQALENGAGHPQREPPRAQALRNYRSAARRRGSRAARRRSRWPRLRSNPRGYGIDRAHPQERSIRHGSRCTQRVRRNGQARHVCGKRRPGVVESGRIDAVRAGRPSKRRCRPCISRSAFWADLNGLGRMAFIETQAAATSRTSKGAKGSQSTVLKHMGSITLGA